ncbi:hypothetical protein ACFYUM_35395 [Streptomyces fimicarius]|uniref:hypothetical protein n=1 Tax=Streptomyces griseus TaxID=1911 RepID=UPI0036BD2634
MRNLHGAQGAGPALRLAVYAIGALILAGVLSLAVASVAGAAPEPAPSPSAPQVVPPVDPDNPLAPAPALTPPRDGTSLDEIGEEAEKTAAAKKKAAWDKKVKEFREQYADGGVLGVFSVTDKDGIPADAYEVILDSGGATDMEQKLQAFLIEGMFAITKWLIAFSCWLIAWSLSWSLAGILLKPALAVSDSLYNQTIVQLGLPAVLLAFSGTVAFWHICFGNRSRGWGEIAASTLISALAVTTFAAPPQLLLAHDQGAVGEVRKLGLTVAALVMGQEEALPEDAELDASGAKALTRPISDALVEAFIVKPSMLLSYDQTFHGTCATQYTHSRIEQALYNQELDKTKRKIQDGINDGTVTEKPGWAQSIDNFIVGKAFDWTRENVVDTEPGEAFEKKCVKGDAGAAKKTSWDKVIGAAFVLFAAFLVFLLLIFLSGKFLITQVLIALEAMVARVAVTAGILPGPGRAWLWERAVSVLRLLGVLVAIVVGLAVFILVVTAVLDYDRTTIPGFEKEEAPGALTVRFFVLDLLCIAAFSFRKKLAAKGRAWAAEARTRLGNSRFGGRAPVQLQDGGRRRSKLAAVAKTGLMIGAMAATGGSAAALGASGTVRGALSTRLAARTVRAGGRTALRTTVGTAKAAGKAGAFGLKYTVGAPVYVPRAARSASAAAQAVPGRVRTASQSLQTRLHGAVGPASRARGFATEYFNNVGGRHVVNRYRMHRGLAPLPPSHGPASGSSGRSGTPARTRPAGPVRPPAARAAAARAPQPAAAGRRPVPAPVPARPASARQASLQLRLHRARTRPTPPSATAPTPRPGPLPGNRPRGGRGRGGRL